MEFCAARTLVFILLIWHRRWSLEHLVQRRCISQIFPTSQLVLKVRLPLRNNKSVCKKMEDCLCRALGSASRLPVSSDMNARSVGLGRNSEQPGCSW